MKRLNKVELEVGSKAVTMQGMTRYHPAAFITIETEDDNLLNRLVAAVSYVETEDA